MSAAAPALVILAAGASRRLGEPKALAPLRPGPGGTALELLLAAAADAEAPPPLVVTGAHHDALVAHLAEALARGLLEVLRNAAWDEGRSGGLRLAVARHPGRDLLVAPVDTPLVAAGTFAALRAEWRRLGAPARGWLAPETREGDVVRHGHPVLVGRELAADLKTFPPDRPLRRLRDAATPLASLRVEDPAVLDDLDGPADLALLRARLRSR